MGTFGKLVNSMANQQASGNEHYLKLLINNYIHGEKDGEELRHQILPELTPEKLKVNGSKFTFTLKHIFRRISRNPGAHERFELISLFKEPLNTSVVEQLGYREGKKHGSHVKFMARKYTNVHLRMVLTWSRDALCRYW